jgi:thiol-disulfide isomerase/thioredoxin
MSRRLPIVLLSVAAVMGGGLVAYKATHPDDTAILSKPGVAETGKLPVAPKLDGKTLPNLALVDFSGAKRQTRDLMGKPAVINVWQESCLPCKDEMPAFEKVHQALGDRVRFVGMNPQDDPERATAFAKKIGITYDLWRDEAGEIYSSLKLTSLPSTILVDAVGKIVWSKSGPLTGDQLTAKINEVFPA